MPATLNQLQQFVKHSRRGQRSPSERLMGLIFERATPALLGHFTPDALAALGEQALAFLTGPGELKVRVYNPTLETHGWVVPYTVLELSLPDRPFIVDSVRAEVKRCGLEVAHVLHPVVTLGDVTSEQGVPAAPSGSEGTKAAYEMFFVTRLEDAATRTALEEGVRDVLNDVLLATRDYGAMRARAESLGLELDALAEDTRRQAERADELAEYAAFMHWLAADNFVFLGYREYDLLDHAGVPSLQTTPGSGLGVLRKKSSAYEAPTPLADIAEGLRERILGGRVVTVSKTNAEATVHRPVRMDYIGVKKVREGTFVGESRFLGLFTSKALATPVEEIPILRRKLRLVLELDGAERASHDFKQIEAIFNSIPREELFWSDARRLQRDIRTVMAMALEGGVRLTLRPDPLARGLAVMVIMPRERFNAAVRRKVQAFLAEELAATHTDYQLAIGEDEEQVRFHFFFSTETDYRTLDLAALESGVAALTRSWDDRLRELLVRSQGQGAGGRLGERYLGAFDARYRADTTPETALRDIESLEALEHAPFVVNLLNPQQPGHASQQGLGREASHLEVYHRGRTLVLSEVLPILENLGLRVLEQVSYTFELNAPNPDVSNLDAPNPEAPHPQTPAADGAGELRTVRGLDIFRVQDLSGAPLEVKRNGALLRGALLALLQGEVENDRLSRLVLYAGLTVRQVALLRALQMYYAQLTMSVSRAFIRDTLLKHPALAAGLFERFALKFAPNVLEREEKLAAAEAVFEEGLQVVSSLAEDETLRGLDNLVEAAVRTNYFLDKPYISLKLESRRVTRMPEPRPLFEIAVSAPHVEGTHLRGGRIARGGLRWSDRPDDFRTEILGLMKTQMTKNAPIVPVGSKGGFVLKGVPAERDALQAFVREQYQTYLRGLLDLTDNLVNGEAVQPAGLVVYDDPDPYLVVAADKGTATFSDLANETTAEYDFWLGDAFASGGSYGYDHKAEGITAWGAWESVKRHFLELGVDVMRDPITVFGIGDMSGDVFGNGLLYTKTLKLQAAFNHLHIFLDPDPDPALSFTERERLFRLPRSTWDDYDRAHISEGGGVYVRAAKRIPLSPQVRAMLDVEEALSGQDLIQAILKMPADLFWNGGVGTYVKAGAETHAEVGDSSNNAVRVDAADLRVRVVGEGGNLGLTQLARVEYALAGGRINTDAVDNSAGVDMSDHEVNLKISLRPKVAEGALTFGARNALLREMTAEVSALVLKDNARQALALSLAARRAARDPALFVSLQEYLAERGDLRPAVEFLPNAKTALGRGYTRPELAVLMAYTKMGLYRRLLETDFPDEPHFQHYLFEYFPEVLQRRYPEAIAAHPLRREIIATQFTNTTVDLLGISFVHRTLRDTGSSPVEIVRGALLALEILGAPALLAAILDSSTPAEVQYDELDAFARAVEEVVAWLLGGSGAGSVPDCIARYQTPLAVLRRNLGDLVSEGERERYDAKVRALQADGFAPELAAELVSLRYLPSAMGVIDVARETGTATEDAARHLYALGERLSLGELRNALAALPTKDKWEKIALGGLIMDLRRLQVGLSVRYLESGIPDPDAFLSRQPQLLRRFDTTLAEVQRGGEVSLASAYVLRGLVQRLLLERPGS
jgi:glutamate dehydrogenase